MKNTQGEAIESIYCGWESSFFITVTGKLFSWGAGQWRALGDGTSNSRVLPEIVDASYYDNAKIVKFGCTRYCLALTSDGSIYSWGENEYGQLGSGVATVKPKTDRTKFSYVLFEQSYMNTITRVRGKFDTVAFMDDSGSVYGFGGM